VACHTKALTNFYRCTIESILSGCITAWYGSCSAHNRKALQRVARSAQRITGGKLPALQDTYTTRCYRKAIKIIKDNSHRSHCLSVLCPTTCQPLFYAAANLCLSYTVCIVPFTIYMYVLPQSFRLTSACM
jgi:hypothetical protein